MASFSTSCLRLSLRRLNPLGHHEDPRIASPLPLFYPSMRFHLLACFRAHRATTSQTCRLCARQQFLRHTPYIFLRRLCISSRSLQRLPPFYLTLLQFYRVKVFYPPYRGYTIHLRMRYLSGALLVWFSNVA